MHPGYLLLSFFDRGEWQSVPNLKKEIARYASYAEASLAKDKRINIRISSRDLEDIQARAAEEVWTTCTDRPAFR